MSGDGTKFLASTLLALNMLPGTLGAQPLATGTTIPNARQTVSASRFAGAHHAVNPQESIEPQPTQQPQAEARLAMEQRRREISEALISLAKEDFDRIAKLAETDYSKDLRRRESRLTRYLSEHNPDRPAAIYLDPNKFDTGMALGFSAKATTRLMLGSHNASVSAPTVDGIAETMTIGDSSPFASKGAYTQAPSAHFDAFNTNPQVCVIVPTSAYAPEYQLKGLSYQENIDFINRHESWHCMDNKFTMTGIPKEEVDKIRVGALETSLNSPDQLKAISIGNREESLADVGAAGDMIRKGGRLSLIDNVTAVRSGVPDDIIHYSVASLNGLKAKIEEMGIDKFRRLNDADARKLYESVVENTAMTPKMAEAVITYMRGSDADRDIVRNAPENFRIMEALMTAGAAVHDGADPKTLDDAIARTGPGDDKIRTALTTLRDQISEIGVERFRQLGDEDAAKIAKALDDSGATSGGMTDTAATFWKADAAGRATTQKELAEYRADVPRALDFVKPYGEPPNDAQKAALRAAPPEQPKPLSAAEQKVFEDLAKWDASQLLQDRAFKDEGKITPATLAHAYGKMQNDLRDQLEKNHDDPLLRAKVTKLQQSFITTVQKLDYVEVNAERGVDIFRKEAALTNFLIQQRQAGTPEAAPPEPEAAAPAAAPAEETAKPLGTRPGVPRRPQPGMGS